MADTLQTGKTRWCHYQTAYHFVWIPKYRRRVLTGEVQVGAKAAIEACCVQHGHNTVSGLLSSLRSRIAAPGSNSLSSQPPKGSGNSRSGL